VSGSRTKALDPVLAGAASGGIYSVYVIELDEAVCRRGDCPSRRSGKPHVYVGQTKYKPEQRFAEHLAGGFTARPVVTRHGVRLRQRFYRNWGPYQTREESLAAEARLYNRLQRKRFCVRGGH
jgi:hypothetical protein